MTSQNDQRQELEALRARVRELEASLADNNSKTPWPPTQMYTEYYAAIGFLLGMLAAAVSLLANVIGAPTAGKSPLELIRVYLTFPLGERALQLASGVNGPYAINDGLVLAIGSTLYLATGMLLGVPFLIALVKLTDGRSTAYRMVVASILSVVLWAINFWAILRWLQPLLFGGHWITDPAILPVWVGLATHLIFGWTMALLYPLARFQVYQQPTSENQSAT